MARSAWTWLVYVAADGRSDGAMALANVESHGAKSLALMAAARRGDKVRVLVQEDGADGASRFEIGVDQRTDLGQIDSGDPETMAAFLRWGAETAPAERYAVIVWSHGSGWQSGYGRRATDEAPPAGGERGSAAAPRGYFSSTARKIDALAPNDRAIAGDNGTGQAIDTLELGKLLAAAAPALNGKVDLLLMNACQMASVEVAYQLREHVGVYVATEVDMPASSLPYDRILSELGAKPAMDAEALGALLTERYCEFMAAKTAAPWGRKNAKGHYTFPPGAALTALRPARLEALADAVKTLGAALKESLNQTAQYDVLWTAVKEAPLMADLRLGDLERFARLLDAEGSTPAVRAAARGLIAAARDPQLIVARSVTATIPSAAVLQEQAGITTFLPMPNPDGRAMVADEYQQIDYAARSGWADLLAAWHTTII